MQMNRFAMVLAFTIFFSSTYAQNKYQWKQATSGGNTYKYVSNDPLQTRFYTLKNGLTVILSPNKVEPRIATEIVVRSGSNNDPANHTGLAHYLEHLLFKGTDKFGSLDWQKEEPLLLQIDSLYEVYNATSDVEQRKAIYKIIDQVSNAASKFAIANEYLAMMSAIGSQGTNAFTTAEQTMYVENIPSNTIDKFLTIQAERFRSPVVRLFHTELEAVYEEKNRKLDFDGARAYDAMNAAIFPTHNYGQQTTIGTIEHLKNPSIKAIKAFYKQYYVPNNMAIVMAGDFEPDELIKKIDSHFSYMQAKPFDEYKGPVEAPIHGPVIKEVFGPEAENVQIAFRSSMAGSNAAMMCNIISAILYNGKAGLMDVNLNQQQKVLGASAYITQYKDYGIFLLAANSRQGQSLEEAKDLLLQQIKNVKEGNFEESLIKAMVANYKLNRMQGLLKNGTRAAEMVRQFIYNKGEQWDKNLAYINEVQKITKQDIVDFANTFFTNYNYVVVYKRKGEDKTVVKVEKPAISPIETNAGKTSPFVQSILTAPVKPIQPVWLDYKKDLSITKQGIAELVYVPNKDNELFTLSYRFTMGSWNNRLLPVAIQYLNYLGTDKYTAEQVGKKFYELACNFNIQVGNDETIVTVSGLKENFEQAVALLQNLFTKCLPNETALEGLKKDISRSRANAKLDKYLIAQAQKSYALYGTVNPYNYVLSNEAINKLTTTDLVELLHSLMEYQHCITYFGTATIPQLSATLKIAHPLPASWKPNPPAMQFRQTQQTKPEVLFTNYAAVQADVNWVRNLDQYEPGKVAIINLYNKYFGAGLGSIVFKTIRESKALAYSASASLMIPDTKEERFSMTANIGTQADKFNDAVAAMDALFKEMPKVEQSFVNAQQNMVTYTETERITGNNIINYYLATKKKGIDYDIRMDNYKKYKSFTLRDLYNFHQQQFSNAPFTYCVIGADKSIKMDDLKKYGEIKTVSLEELFGF